VALRVPEDLNANPPRGEERRIWGKASAAKAKRPSTSGTPGRAVLALHLPAGHGSTAGCTHICWYSIPWPLEELPVINGRLTGRPEERSAAPHRGPGNSMDQRISDALMTKDVEQPT
jgi:hypothetical protein